MRDVKVEQCGLLEFPSTAIPDRKQMNEFLINPRALVSTSIRGLLNRDLAAAQ
jgi:hypothetical protein